MPSPPSTPSSESPPMLPESDYDIDEEMFNYMDHEDSLELVRETYTQRLARTTEIQRIRIEQLEKALEDKTAQEDASQTLTELLAERVASLCCFNIRCSLDLQSSRLLVKKLSLALGMLLLGVWLYFFFK